jgi:hypothetical protein
MSDPIIVAGKPPQKAKSMRVYGMRDQLTPLVSKSIVSLPLYKKPLGMKMLDARNSISEIISLFKKICFFYCYTKKIFC